jgi:hypothetical protein
MLGRRTGRFVPLPSPEAAAVHPDLPEATRLPSNRIVGAPATATAALADLARRTEADEVMVTAVTYELRSRVRSLELLAEHWA